MTEFYRNSGRKSTRPYTFSQKWGDDPFTALGHTQLPNALIEYATRIGLKDDECWLIACILRFKHTPSSPFPSQERLAQLLGKSARTIRRRVEAIAGKGLVLIEYPLNDLGQHTHCLYDFTPLRAALNAVYYFDHPDERPTGQKCPVEPPDTFDQTHRTLLTPATGQKCPPNKTLRKENLKEDFLPAASSEKAPEKGSEKDAGQQAVYKAGAAKIKAALEQAAVSRASRVGRASEGKEAPEGGTS